LRKKVIVRAPVLTRSGYGEHGRFVLRALRSRPDLFEVYVIPIKWGETGWIWQDDEERAWMDERIRKTAEYGSSGGQFDISIQVTIPNEWERMAPINIGVTAGIETTKVAPIWLEKANMMDKVITISEHSKAGFVDTVYHGQNSQTGQDMVLSCATPVEVVHYPTKTYKDLPELNLDLEYDFNYLLVAQFGPRKNVENAVRWFMEENFDQEVGLIVKTGLKGGSIIDRKYAYKSIKGILEKNTDPERKCKIYLLHGDMTDAEIHSLYVHPKIKCLVSTTHGEGFGLPLFEAAYSGMPVIAPGWSGQCDFLYAPPQNTKKKGKKKKTKQPYFAEVEYVVAPIQKNAVWEGVIPEDSMWCFPQEGSFKMRLRQVRKNYDKWKKKATILQGWVKKNFKEEDKYTDFVNNIVSPEELEMMAEINDMFKDLSV